MAGMARVAQVIHAELPIDPTWYRATQLDPRLWLITEPRVHPIWSANMHLIIGRNADLLIDTGMGVAPLRPFVDSLRPDPEKRLICLTTHVHIDHFGAVHEFDERLVHPIEAAEMAAPPKYTLRTDGLSQAVHDKYATAGYPALWPLLIDAVPSGDYDIDAYTVQGAPATGTVKDGDVIDLGDWHAEVLHLPGHSQGQVGLFHHASGTLFGADAVYDGPLIYEGEGTDIADYAATLRRLRDLPVTVAHGGHDPAMSKPRLDQIVDHYLQLWGRQPETA